MEYHKTLTKIVFNTSLPINFSWTTQETSALGQRQHWSQPQKDGIIVNSICSKSMVCSEGKHTKSSVENIIK